jgi:transcriptional regulatory protein RtcR
MKQKVVIGFLGTKLDSGVSDKRWERWRPSVALAGHVEAFPLARLELLLTNEQHTPIAQTVANDIVTVSADTEVNAHVLQSVEDPWNFQQVYAALHDFCSNYDFRDDCEYYVHLTTGTHVAQICLFLLTEARYFPAKLVETFTHGGEETWKGRLEVIDLDLSSYDQLAQRFSKESEDSQVLLKGGINTLNPSFNALIARIEKVALRSSAPMLLTGPTGAGKSQMAKRIHELRSRRHLVEGAFVEVNCATLRGDGAMSALFGHKKGAFTGALSDRAGYLRSADKGILFLDEIGCLGLEEQGMLLRALEDKRFMPLGSDKEVSSDFTLLAGTNEDLARAVAEGKFRGDLLARLQVWSFQLPGLAQRREDIEPNLDYELKQSARMLGTRVSMSASARAAYLAFARGYSWPGNFRDLSSSIMRMATLAEGGRISDDEVELEVQQLRSQERATSAAGPAQGELARRVMGDAVDNQDIFDLVQLDAVFQAIAETDSMAQAGRKLYAVSRTARDKTNDSDRVRKFLTRWGLDYTTVKQQLS